MNSKFIDFEEQSQIIEIKQPNNRTTERYWKNKENLYAQLPINKQEHDDIGNFHFHDEALKVANLICT